MKISVIITTYNEEKNIAECIRSILAQTRKPDEVIVVDDGSTDKTVKIASRFPVKLIQIEHSERSRARNIGWQKASGDIICFAEADSVFSTDWIEEILNTFQKGADAVIDRRRPYFSNTFFQKCWKANFDIRYAYYEPFSAWAFRKKVLEDIGGFNEKLIQSEERDLGKRILKKGYRILLAPKAFQWHKGEPKNLKEFIRRFFVSEKRRAQGYLIKYPKEGPWFKLTLLAGFLILLTCSFIFNSYYLYVLIVVLIIAIYFSIVAKIIFVERGWGIVKKRYIFGLAFLRLIRSFFQTLGFIVGKLEKRNI